MKIEWMEKYLNEAERLIYENRVDEGIELLTDLLYEEPGYGSLHNHLGWAYMHYTTDVARAEMHLKLAIKFDGEYPAPYIHLGHLMIRCWRYAEAIQYLRDGMQKPSANRSIFLEAIGQVYELRGDFREAIKAYREAMMTSVADQEVTNMSNHVARCRRKRWAAIWRV